MSVCLWQLMMKGYPQWEKNRRKRRKTELFLSLLFQAAGSKTGLGCLSLVGHLFPR
jgi:hypothetical protein